MKLILAISLLFNSICFGSRSFFSPNMCKDRQRSNDCSFQFPNATTDECLIFNNAECRIYNFSSWNLEPLTVPASESDIPLDISVVPYAFYRYNKNFSAINITMTVLHKDIKGFSFIMADELNSKEKLCRMFDFRTVANREVILYYDCLHYLYEKKKVNVTLTFQIYPQNIKVAYLLSIPPAPFEYYDSPCSWRPLVMVFQGGLQSYHIQLKFSNAPDNLDILLYVVTLLDINDTDMKNIRIHSNNRTNMLSTKFVSVEEGYFSVSISIVGINGTSCEVAKTHPFFVGYKMEDYSIVTLIVLLTAILIFASVLLYIIFHRRCTEVKPPSLTLLFVYSFDCPQHKEFLLAYIKFIEENYAVKIYTIYGNSGSPNAWIEERYFASDIVVFVISEGLFHNFEKNNIPPLVEDHWQDQLTAARKFISEQKFIRSYSDDKSKRMKKVCKICFPYSGKQHIPKCLLQEGSLFMLPNDEDKFLCFIFGCSKFMSCKTHKKKRVNYQHIKDKLAVMKETVSKNMHISFKENEIKDSISETIQSLNSSAICEENHQCSSGDFLKSIFEEKGKENIEFSTLKSNFTNLENKDSVGYFIHKEFHNRNLKD